MQAWKLNLSLQKGTVDTMHGVDYFVTNIKHFVCKPLQ